MRRPVLFVLLKTDVYWLCWHVQIFSILYGLFSMLGVSHLTGNIFHASWVVSQSLLNCASIWLLGLLLSKCLCTLCQVLQETSMATPWAPRAPLSPPALQVVFVLWQVVPLMRPGSTADMWKPRTQWEILCKNFLCFRFPKESDMFGLPELGKKMNHGLLKTWWIKY